MSAFALGCNSNIIGKLGDFIKFYGKIPDIFVLITGHFGLFKTPTLRLGEAGTTQTQSQTRRLRIAKTDFKSVRKTILSATIETIETTVKKGEKVTLVGFGTFERRERAARKGRNPQTGKEIKIAAKKVPAFSAGKKFKDAVAK